jgi:hypothetical protein
MRTDGAGETNGETLGGEKEEKKQFKYVTHDITGKYPEHFAKESKEISYRPAFYLHY